MNIGGFLRRNGVAIVLFGGFFVFGGLIISPSLLHARYVARRSDCQSHVKAIAMACQQYRADYDGRYPPLSDGGTRGWSLLIQKGTGPLDFSCREGSESSFSPTSDYFFNAHLAQRRSYSVKNPELTIAFGEGSDNGPTNSHYWELPNDGSNPDSVLRRHYNTSNYAFADGHVKMITPEYARQLWQDAMRN
ncbi:hypothetical protein IAD21_04072 [Abditibacteriota bacterium]|nr:hypothetical protein IAD21_04072 [Abditibacteriota bacterium]